MDAKLSAQRRRQTPRRWLRRTGSVPRALATRSWRPAELRDLEGQRQRRSSAGPPNSRRSSGSSSGTVGVPCGRPRALRAHPAHVEGEHPAAAARAASRAPRPARMSGSRIEDRHVNCVTRSNCRRRRAARSRCRCKSSPGTAPARLDAVLHQVDSVALARAVLLQPMQEVAAAAANVEYARAGERDTRVRNPAAAPARAPAYT